MFVWAKIKSNKTSIDYVDSLLNEKGIFIAPGSIFGSNGEGYVRFHSAILKPILKSNIKIMKKKIYVIGVGLIGGSFAIDMRKLFPKSTIIGIDKSEIHLQKALELKLIDETSELSKINNPDIIVISVPVKSILNILPIVLKSVNNNSLVIDFGSTKKIFAKL